MMTHAALVPSSLPLKILWPHRVSKPTGSCLTRSTDHRLGALRIPY